MEKYIIAHFFRVRVVLFFSVLLFFDPVLYVPLVTILGAKVTLGNGDVCVF
jgi:hypothetical protein